MKHFYQAYGSITGSLVRLEDGWAVSRNGLLLPATINPPLMKWLESPVCLHTRWGCYPRTEQNGKLYGLEVRCSNPQLADNQFIVSGKVVDLADQTITVRIQQNTRSMRLQWQPFQLQLQGVIPSVKIGDIWRFRCELDENENILKIHEKELRRKALPLPKKRELKQSA